MSESKQRILKHKRNRQDKTNYKKRLELLKSKEIRLIIRKSKKNIVAQLIKYEPSGDKTLCHANSKEIEKLGWEFQRKNIPCAYLVGFLLGKKAQKNKIKSAILDIGRNRNSSKSKIYATLKGVVDGGVNVPCSPDVFPENDRITGKHISNFSKEAKNNEKYKNQFSKINKENSNIENIEKIFEEIKNKIKDVKNG